MSSSAASHSKTAVSDVPTIVNGSMNGSAAAPAQGAVTFAAMGVPMTGAKTSNIQFGFPQSPALPVNTPHAAVDAVPSPQMPPSPIPQPSKSGGVPGSMVPGNVPAGAPPNGRPQFGMMLGGDNDSQHHGQGRAGFTPQQTHASLTTPSHGHPSPQTDVSAQLHGGPHNRNYNNRRGNSFNNSGPNNSPRFANAMNHYGPSHNFQSGQNRAAMAPAFTPGRGYNPPRPGASPAMVPSMPVTTPNMGQASLMPMNQAPYHYGGPPTHHHGHQHPPVQQVESPFFFQHSSSGRYDAAPSKHGKKKFKNRSHDADKLSRNYTYHGSSDFAPTVGAGSELGPGPPRHRRNAGSNSGEWKWSGDFVPGADRDGMVDEPTLQPTLQPVRPPFPIHSPQLPPPDAGPIDLSPQSGNFERKLMEFKQPSAGYPPHYMNHSYYQPQMHFGNANAGPFPPPFMAQAPPFQPAAHNMSRQSSHSERPNSSASNQQPANQPPVVVSSQPPPQAVGTSAAPSPSAAIFRPAKRTAITIKNPQGVVVDLSTVMAPSSPGPAPPASDSAPAPPTKASAPQHTKTDSTVKIKTTKEIQDELREKVGLLAGKPKPEPTPAPAPSLSDADKAAPEPATESTSSVAPEPTEAVKQVEAPAATSPAAPTPSTAPAEGERVASKVVDAVPAAAEPEPAAPKPETPKPEGTGAMAAATAAPAAEEPSKAEPAAASTEDDELERMIREMEEADAKREEEQARRTEKLAAEKAAAAEKAEADRKANAAEEDRKLREAERKMERLEEEKERQRAQRNAAAEGASMAELLAAPRSAFGTATTSGAGPQKASDLADKLAELKITDAKPADGHRTMAQRAAKPAALNLKTSNAAAVEPPQPSAALQSLRSARFLSVIDQNIYPPGIHSPNPALNAAVANKGKAFKYDASFLLQFQKVFTEQPSLEFGQQVKSLIGDGEGRSGSSKGSVAGYGRTNSRGGSGAMQSQPMGPMGAFGSSLSSGRGPASSGMGGAHTGRPPVGGPLGSFGSGKPFGGSGLSRSASQAAAAMPHSPSGRQSSRQGTRNRDRKVEQDTKKMPLTQGQELKPLQASSGGWKPLSVGNKSAQAPTAIASQNGHLDPTMVQRKVKAALNKMTPEKFDKISAQILEIAAQSKNETDGRTLRQVIQLTFEKATDEMHWAGMYAQFCRRMLDQMDNDIRDESIRDKNGNVVSGGALFRKYLLNRCQEDFERGWSTQMPEKQSGEDKTGTDEKSGADGKPSTNGKPGEAAMLSDEYYIAAAAKRRGLGLVQFIGELFKLQMLTERIMHQCVHKLVDFKGVPDEAEVESLSKLLRTIGANLDASEKGRPVMDIYFERIRKMMEIPELPSRFMFMLMDVVDLRKANWVGKETNKGPKTLEEVRIEAEAQQALKAQEAARNSQRGPGTGRLPMGRQDARHMSSNFPQPMNTHIPAEDLRRLKGAAARAPVPASGFGSSMFGSRSNSGRKTMFGSSSRHGDDSSGPSRAGTPAGQANTYSILAQMDSENPASPPSVNASPAPVKATPDTSEDGKKSD